MRISSTLIVCVLLGLPMLHAAAPDPIVFVSRQKPPRGSDFWTAGTNMQPGVGAYSRFVNASPGKLMVLETNGTLRTLVDGSNPAPATFNLVDVSGPNVSYDGNTIVFAGLNNPSASRANNSSPNAWRIYSIKADGTGLRQITTSDQVSNPARGTLGVMLGSYDDFDPCWLPDGRIVFSSTRWPEISFYSGARASNLHVINANGTGLHRITSERSGAERPLVDPVTGKIVYFRWWRNIRYPQNDMSTVLYSSFTIAQPAYFQKDGLKSYYTFSDETVQVDFNMWQASFINPDGTGLAMFTGNFRDRDANHFYGGSFQDDGTLYANFFPMGNMSEAAGFGGIRVVERGPNSYVSFLGVTARNNNHVLNTGANLGPSFGIQPGRYATEPEAMTDNTVVVSMIPAAVVAGQTSIDQDYGLYRVDSSGNVIETLYDNVGTSELQARAIRARTVPPIIADQTTQWPGLLPPAAAGPYDIDGTFFFDALNVYANAPVDARIPNAPPVGSAAKIRFFANFEQHAYGSFNEVDWPILLGEKAIDADGSVSDVAPAFIPLFEQLRSTSNTVPRTGNQGFAHVAGLNFGPAGGHARCVGCHSGHTMIPVPASDEEAKWTNLAPGAVVQVSSDRDGQLLNEVIDRKVQLGQQYQTNWVSTSATGQWVTLTFPVPITIRTVRLYDVRQGDSNNSSLHVTGARVRVYADWAATQEIAVQTVGGISVGGTDVPLPTLPRARVIKVEITGATGTWSGSSVSGLGEIEVIARGGIAAGVGFMAPPKNLRFR